ncbi:MAG: thioredoxin family protein [Desulfurococcales archaeon]|nr:thioredoxin family protein [Desulfurococcales archaeon]
MPQDNSISEALEIAREKLLLESFNKKRKLKECCSIPRKEPLQATTLEELDKILKSCKLALIFFTSPTCPYCRMFEPVFEETASLLGDRMAFIRIDTYYSHELAYIFGIMGTPTIIAVRRGKEIDRIVGLPPIEYIEEVLENMLELENCPIPEAET